MSSPTLISAGPTTAELLDFALRTAADPEIVGSSRSTPKAVRGYGWTGPAVARPG